MSVRTEAAVMSVATSLAWLPDLMTRSMKMRMTAPSTPVTKAGRRALAAPPTRVGLAQHRALKVPVDAVDAVAGREPDAGRFRLVAASSRLDAH